MAKLGSYAGAAAKMFPPSAQQLEPKLRGPGAGAEAKCGATAATFTPLKAA